MVSVCKLLRYQLDFSTWATERMLAAAAKLPADQLSQDFKTSDKSILGTLAHIYRADRVWLNRLQGNKVDFRVAGDDTLTALQANWPALRLAWSDWARGLTDESASSDFSYSDLKGNPWQQPLWLIVMQVVNHSTHHRGQAVGFMRSLGHTPPNVDLITFSRERM